MRPKWLWSVRRELWEHRWVYVAPLLVGAVLTVGGTLHVTSFSAETFTATVIARDVSMMLDLLTRMLLVTGTVVAFVYCAEALHGERRDRSILFWKSVPVSDAVAVWAKASVPLVLIPIVTVALLLVAQLVTRGLLTGSGVELVGPLTSPGAAIAEACVTALWQAPIYGWILLVSGWARRAPLLWALLPMVSVTMIQRMMGAQPLIADVLSPRGPLRHWPRTGHWPNLADYYDMSALPARTLLLDPALWVGAALAIVFILGASRLRQRQRPL